MEPNEKDYYIQLMSTGLRKSIKELEDYLKLLNSAYSNLLEKYPKESCCDKSVILRYCGDLVVSSIDIVRELVDGDETEGISYSSLDVDGVDDVVIVYRDYDVICQQMSCEVIRSCYACHKKNNHYYGLTSEELEPVINAMKQHYGSTDITFSGLKLREKEKNKSE